jgi:hypothetical protein
MAARLAGMLSGHRAGAARARQDAELQKLAPRNHLDIECLFR